MKKNLFLWFLLAIVGMVATGCESCKSENKKQDAPVGDVVINVANDYDGNLGGKLVAEHVISTQRETMFSLAQGKDYNRETRPEEGTSRRSGRRRPGWHYRGGDVAVPDHRGRRQVRRHMGAIYRHQCHEGHDDTAAHTLVCRR